MPARLKPALCGMTIAALILNSAQPPARGELPSTHEDFARDPKWQAHNNRPDPSVCQQKVQDFGYSRTNHAGGEVGEIGGVVSRSLTPAAYARKIEPRTL